ncbi:phosphate ABC transporter substrate-binding protein (PhoT family) [Asanoa ferruginea]|uniref:Phosphate ABC transporter substrate-binding protein (PhoT family) n=1 Tax=Asanoa ferruginea TaxID=53367 RepID=A0A3D9ZL99_9ACTN|nr:phosphate ABC transporter substrate-binding protein PstS [Asanoa ferruginea]REF97364.1 phosphate ABC transporter substrate-binding protein (PhoT family) [Asanoa ferruginea]GIF51171.1 phosphate ABC transporter substrate-binding protein PstS [Asanoa ferruginea]
MKVRALIAAATAVAIVALVPAPAAAAPRRVPINGAGSTWSANAIDNWRRNVLQRNLYINYQPTGSTDGRNQFRNAAVDFGVSEIPYGLRDSFGGADNAPPRKFAYMPIVAGGTAFMYNLKIGGRQVTNLRLSGDVVADIFTGVIKTWNDSRIKADNPGLTLPNRRIVPVVRQDGSGTSAQFTLWMSKQYPSIWNAYCRKFGKPAPCGITSLYPFRSSDGFVGQQGSTGVTGYVQQANAEGAITYVEYSYAIGARFPVVKLRNRADYYVEPTAPNVAVALTKARINSNSGSRDYLTQILDDVYSFTDPRVYPLSSYSYMIVPTELGRGINIDKGYTLGEFANYFLCEGQQQADVLGYSPLPKNLVEAGFAQVAKIPGAVKRKAPLEQCNNPTFSKDGSNTLAKTAPQPSPCDKRGAKQSSTGTGGAKVDTPVTASARCTPTGQSTGGATATGAPSAGPTASASAGPQDVGAGGGDDTELVGAEPVDLAGRPGWGLQQTTMLLVGLVVLGLVLIPPLLATRWRNRADDRERRR